MHDGLSQIESMDLNLLWVLHVLLDEGSVTGAAQRLGRTPSAVSHALSRLREALDDPLLVRSGNRLVPSPRALALQDPLARVLADLQRAITSGSSFEPATSTRRFTIIAPDVLGLLLGGLLRDLRARAPGVSLELKPPRTSRPWEELAAVGGDLLLAPLPDAGDALMTRRLGTLAHAVLLRADHPALVDGQLSKEAYARVPHVFVRTATPGPSLVGQALAAAGISRTVGVVVPSFVLAPVMVADTDLLFTAPEPLVRSLVDRLGLVVVPAPVPIPDVPVAMVWHRRVQEDPGHRWLRGLLADRVAAWLNPPPTDRPDARSYPRSRGAAVRPPHE